MAAPLVTNLIFAAETAGTIATIADLLVDMGKAIYKAAEGVNETADELTRSKRKIADLSQSPEEADFILRRLREQASRVGAPVADIVNSHAAAVQATAGLHLTHDQVMQLSENVQKITINAGGTVKQAVDGVTQFFEALHAGTVDADKLRDTFSAVPGLANVLRDNLTGSTSELTRRASAGTLGSEAVFDAVLMRTTKINDAFARLEDTGEQLRNRTATPLDPSSTLEGRLSAAYRNIDLIEARYNARGEMPGGPEIQAANERGRQQELLQARQIIAKLEDEREREELAPRAREAAARQEKFKQARDEQKAAEQNVQLAERQTDATTKGADIREKAAREIIRSAESQEASLNVTEKQNSEYEKSHQIASALLSCERDRAVLLDRCIAVLQQYALLCAGVTAEQKVQQDCLATQSRLTDEVCRKTEDAAAAQKKCTDELGKSIGLTAERTRSRDNADKLAEDARKKAGQPALEAKASDEANKASDDIRKKADELSRDIAEAIYDAGSKGGKSFWEKFHEWGRATIKRLSVDMVLKPIIQPVMMSIVGAVPQLFGITGSSGTTVSSGGLGSILSPINDAIDLVKNFVGDTVGNATSWINRIGTSIGFGPGTTIPAPSVFTEFGVLPPSEFIGPMPLAEGMLGTTQTFSGLLGNVGMGFAAGNMLNGLVGGDSTGGMIGSGIGSLIGAGLALIPGMQIPGLLLSLMGGAGGGLLGGLLGKDEDDPRGYAGGEIGNNNRFSATDVHQAGLDGYDNSRDRQEMAKFAETMNATMDRYRLSFAVDKDTINSNGAYNGLLTIGTMYGGAKDAADLFMRWFKSGAGTAAGPARVTEDDWMRSSGYTRSSSYDRDTGWTYDLRDKAGNEVTQDTWNSEYEKWREAQKQSPGPGGALFKSDDVYVQKALDRMASGDTKIKDADEVQKFLELAGSFKDAADRAAAGVNTLKRQTLEWEIAARDAGRALEKTVKDYVKSAKDLYGENSDEAKQAALTQRQNIFGTMKLDPNGQIIAPGTNDRRKGVDAEIAQMTAQFNAYQKALEATGLSAEAATAIINRGIESTTAHIRDAHLEKDRRTEAGFTERETGALIALGRGPQMMTPAVIGARPIDPDLFRPDAYTASRNSLAERQRQELVDAENAGLSSSELTRLRYIQGLERETQLLAQANQIADRNGTLRTRELNAQLQMHTPGVQRADVEDYMLGLQHWRELVQAQQDGWSKAEIEGLKYVQSLEKQAAAYQRMEQNTRVAEEQRSRELRAQLILRKPGASQDQAEIYELDAKQRQELFDAQSKGYTAAQMAGLQYVQGLEKQALALQQAERARQKEEAYLLRTAQALVGLLAGSSAQQQGQYLVEDIQRQIAQSQELRNATSEADRARILEIQHLEDASIAVQRAAAAQQQYNEALKTAKGQIESFRNSVGQWLDQQQVNQVGGPTAMASYLAAQQQYNAQLDKVRAGDPTAMGSITGYADRLIAAMQALDRPNAVANLEASKAAFDALVTRAQAGDADAMSQVLAQADQYRQIGLGAYGSTEEFQTLLAQIQQTMKDLPGEISPEDMARKAIEKLNEDLVPPTKEQLEVIKSLERLSAATKSALGYSGFSLSDQQTAIQILQQNQVFEAKEGNRLAGLILDELKKTPAPSTPTTPTVPTPTGPSAMDAYTSLMSLAGTVSIEADRLRGMGLLQAQIDAQIESQYGSYRNSLLDIMAAQPALIQQFGQSYWRENYTAGPAYARKLLTDRGIMPAFEYGGLALSLGGPGSAFPAILHHGERVLTNEQDAIFTRLSDAMLQQPRWSMPAAQRPANDHVVAREVLAEMREQKEQGEQVVSLLALLVARLGGGDADDATLDDVVDAINRLQPALRGGQALAGARPISKAG